MVTTDDAWADLVFSAHALHDFKEKDVPNVGHRGSASGPPSDDQPGTDFNLRGTWEETGLFDAGWKWLRRDGDKGLVTRPGKDSGVSGSVGMVSSEKNKWPLFWNWSTSVPSFPPDVGFSRFGVYTILNHAGDFSVAAKELKSKGYGKKADPLVIFSRQVAVPMVETGTGEPARIFLWMSELRMQVENEKWLWRGYLSRGGVTLFSALWKIGKSTLLSHLIRSFDGRRTEFLGMPILPSKILYVTEETEELWAERRDDLGIGDHVGMVCRPFRGRATTEQWVEFLGKVAQTVADHRFDIVVFDSLSKLWPVREENDAGNVEEALMPLWKITDTGAALLLVHHSRKSGGGEFTGSRGSGGLPAFCETLMEFYRHSENTKDTKRILGGKGRYSETPDKMLIELTPGGYVSHGDPDDPSVKVIFGNGAWREFAMQLINLSETGVTRERILEGLGEKTPRKDELWAWLEARAADGEIEKTGTGRRGSPFLYKKLVFLPLIVSPGTETGTETDYGDGEDDDSEK